MNVRDGLVFAVVFLALPAILAHPYIGVLYWVWLGVMNPHRLTWGPAFFFPFSQVVAIATFAGLLLTRDERRFKGGMPVFALLLFVIWTSITTAFALNPSEAFEMWQRVMKIQLMIQVGLLVLWSQRHLFLLLWVLVLSIGFYGIKGGIFTILNGGEFIVWGPPASFIEDNTSLALALVMIIPLMYFLLYESPSKWVKLGMAAAMVSCAAAALGSYSRGAFLAIGAMSAYLWLKSPHKIVPGVAVVVIGIALITMMPERWDTRMNTITGSVLDESALGRINAWKTAINIARANPVLGGGFELYTREIFQQYSPNPADLHSAHSIYFQVLGEHGFVGLFLFLLMWVLTWLCASWITKQARRNPEHRWAGLLASMIQVSLVGYAVGGAFLNLAYWDLPYYELVIMVVVRDIIQRAAVAQPRPAAVPPQTSKDEPMLNPAANGTRAL